MKMMFLNVRRVAAVLLYAFAASAFAQTMADAQKAYVAGKWQEAAAAYEKACPNEPKEKQAECYLWNVLALSQTGDVQSFKIAGKRLDSLIQNENPQNSIYADLMMTSAQFRLYLGKYDKAAEDLIHAIETSHPHQAVVLQKVCTAVKAKIHSEDLIERCNKIRETQPKRCDVLVDDVHTLHSAVIDLRHLGKVKTLQLVDCSRSEY